MQRRAARPSPHHWRGSCRVHRRWPSSTWGAGTGANLRYLAPRLGGVQDWVLVEHDPTLQQAVQAHTRSWASLIGVQLGAEAALPGMQGQCLVIRGGPFECRVSHRTLDLAQQWQQLPLSPDTLLCASALLDLVSERWLRSLLTRAHAVGAAMYFALSYDGRMECLPAEPEDAQVRDGVNSHQLTDKGFGPALGPRAAAVTQELLQSLGYQVGCARSDWHLGPGDQALQRALVRGWFEAACESAPPHRPGLESWLQRRLAHIESGRSRLTVGHIDVTGHLPQLRTDPQAR